MTRRDSHPILLLADHKWRDLPGLALLKVLLEDDHGLPVRIVHYNLWAAALLAFRPRVVCPTTMTGPREQAIARTARQMGAAVVVIPSEGIPADDGIMPVVACTHVDLSSVDLWLAWSSVVRDYMLAHGTLRPEQIVLTGVNRFDFYTQPLRQMLLPNEELRRRYGLPPGKPIVTWGTNFGHAGYVRSSNEAFIERDWQLRGLTKFPTYSKPREYAAADDRAMQAAQAMMKEVFRRFPDVNFIVKTHPAERLDIYLQYLGECRQSGLHNVFLVNREYIGDVLNASSVHIHRYCTTGVEAWMMGVPTLNLHLDGWHLNASSGGSSGEAARHDSDVRSADDISSQIQFYLRGGRVDATKAAGRTAHLSRWLYRVDGASAARQAQAIASFVAGRRFVPSQPLRSLGSARGSAIRGMIAMRCNQMLGRHFDASLRPEKRHAGLQINMLGYVDRIARQPDVEDWCRRLREFAAASNSGHGLPAESIALSNSR